MSTRTDTLFPDPTRFRSRGARRHALPLTDGLVGIGVGDGAGGNGLHAGLEIGAAGVRVSVIVGADRADDGRDRALLCRDIGAGEAAAAVIAIAAAVLRGCHLVVDEGDLDRKSTRLNSSH